jgi:hypothetical protein
MAFQASVPEVQQLHTYIFTAPTFWHQRIHITIVSLNNEYNEISDIANITQNLCPDRICTCGEMEQKNV